MSELQVTLCGTSIANEPLEITDLVISRLVTNSAAR